MTKIKIGGLTVDVDRKDIKHLHLNLYPPAGNRIRVAAPNRMNDDSIRLFVVSKLGWIKKQQKKYNGQERFLKKEYVSRESHYLFGKRYLMIFDERGNTSKIEIKGNNIIFISRRGATLEQKEVFMNEWYRRKLKAKIPGIIKKYEKLTDISVSDWGVKIMRTRWGTCNREAKRIWVNLELAKKPVHCLEYIVLHEMLHIKERRHNDKFRELLAGYMPKWKLYKAELNSSPLKHEEWKY